MDDLQTLREVQAAINQAHNFLEHLASDDFQKTARDLSQLLGGITDELNIKFKEIETLLKERWVRPGWIMMDVDPVSGFEESLIWNGENFLVDFRSPKLVHKPEIRKLTTCSRATRCDAVHYIGEFLRQSHMV